jgi:sigma-70-like protein
MYEQVKPIAGVLLNMEEDLKREFETRIAETSTLAFRVAFAVLRNSEDAEDVTQEAFAKAYRWFSSESVIRRPRRLGSKIGSARVSAGNRRRFHGTSVGLWRRLQLSRQSLWPLLFVGRHVRRSRRW